MSLRRSQVNLRERIAFSNMNIAYRNAARAFAKDLLPIWEAYGEAINEAYETIQRHKLYGRLPSWIPHRLKLWIVERWPKRFLPK